MKTILKQFKQISITAAFMLLIVHGIAQEKRLISPQSASFPVSRQLKMFYRLAAQANAMFIYPKGFKEIKAPDNEYFSFDYALALPDKGFEIWFQVKSEKENWASYVRAQDRPNAQLANPDSAYNELGKAYVNTFSGDQKYFERNIPRDVLVRYHADAGKSYLLNLLNLSETKHYKYALLITLQKNHTGTIVAVCFTNEKGPEFYKNIMKASNCLKFKP